MTKTSHLNFDIVKINRYGQVPYLILKVGIAHIYNKL